MKKTKILATYGPAIASEQKIRRLVKAGVNAFRVNCSHGDKSDFVAAARLIRRATRSAGYPVGLLFDISGPKLRVARFDGELPVAAKERITLTSGKTDLADKTLGVNHPGIIASVKKGHRVFIDDGQLIFTVRSTAKGTVKLEANNAGTILPGKGINLPDSDIQIPTIGEKDKEDIATAIECDVDYIALSFVRTGDDIIELRRIIHRLGGRQRVIAKLEKPEAITNLEIIMNLVDGVMVARGDLGVELPPSEVPRLQKKIIKVANQHHKPVIVATQMLESMRFNPRPTRAEVNDVATAVFDFADCVMLSAETAAGKYPVEAVETMSNVIERTEESAEPPMVDVHSHLMRDTVPLAIADAVSRSDRFCRPSAVFAFTTSGFTAQMIANLFPPPPVIALTPDKRVMRQLTLHRSVYSIKIRQPKSFEDMLDTVQSVGRKHKLIRKGDSVVITGGAPFGSTVPTNFMMFHTVK